MNKLVKGSIAGAAGLALLLGGAGTFALWSSTASVTAQSISSGRLTLAANNDGVWKTLDGTTIDPAIYRVIPGQTLVFTQSLTVTATGNGLKANLSYSGMTGTGGLDQYVTKTLAVTSTTATTNQDGSLAFTAGASTVDVKLTVAFPTTVTGTQGQNTGLDLSALTFTLAQTL